MLADIADERPQLPEGFRRHHLLEVLERDAFQRGVLEQHTMKGGTNGLVIEHE